MVQALVKKAKEPGAAFEEVSAPRPKPGEALLKVHRASICGSDMAIYDWNSWAPERVKPPLIFGHELCGEVIEANSCKIVKPGDKVAVESHIYCGTCAACKSGDPHLCHQMNLVGIDIPGGFAQEVCLPEACLWKILDARLYDYASMLEPCGNAYYATCAEPIEGKTVLVMGCGPQGLFAIQVAKACGAKEIVALEKSAYRQALAKKVGADRVVGAEAKMEEILGGLEGFDAALEMSGAASLVPLGIKALRNGGRISLFGIPSKKIELDVANDVIFKGIRIYGIMGRKIWDTWERMERLLDSGKINLAQVATHTFPLEDFEKAFELMHDPERASGKILFSI